ncbi:MAG TPA: SMP-30/gluconolactonase/LRE family protein [Xanthobacteraceae bacterium]|nr:SMP-30/gluconolactonase/LRE family protein [Xanthobacteraceae bacterium]
MDIDMRAPGLDEIVGADPPLDIIAHGLVFGEGPVWDKRKKRFLWTEIIGDSLWEYTPGVGSKRIMHPTGHGNGLTFDLEGRLLCAGWGSRRIWRIEHDGAVVTVASHYEGKKFNSPNDIVVRSDGTIYWTDSAGGLVIPGMPTDDLQRYLDVQGVFCLTPKGEVHLAIADCTYPNGLAFSVDEKILYVNDSRLGIIRAFDVAADGSCGPGRLFHKLAGTEGGVADGMKVDQKDNVYCTGPGGIHIIDKGGKLLGRLRVPGHCTNLAWGGDDWRSLYITTFHDVVRTRLQIPGVPVW